MRLYLTRTSPYARLVRIVVHELGLTSRVEEIEAQTRALGSPYYQVNPSGRVPYLLRDDGVGMEDSQLICLYLDSGAGGPRLHLPFERQDWAYGRLETYARSLVDGISVWVREMRRPERERSPTVLAHEATRAQRLADFWESEVEKPLMTGPPSMAQLLLAVALISAKAFGLGDLTAGRPGLAAWARHMRQRQSIAATGGGL